jgi:Domain of unknown function (DUF4272)
VPNRRYVPGRSETQPGLNLELKVEVILGQSPKAKSERIDPIQFKLHFPHGTTNQLQIIDSRRKMMLNFKPFPLLLVGMFSLFVSRPGAESSTNSLRKEKISKMETEIAKDAIERKIRSESILIKQKVPISKNLPAIESESVSKKRTVEEIAYRALALLVVALKGEGLDQKTVKKLLNNYGLESHFTPKESAFLKNQTANDDVRASFSWRYESAWTLLWALGYVEVLGMPTSICDVSKAVTIMKERSTRQFIKEAKLRPLSQILDEADLIYRYHWIIVETRLKQMPAPAGLEPGVTFERHFALNWLIGYEDQEWDDIRTDT